ncbi:hypothetical protein RISK_004590 [Rhodopirellula islandica]|uniref:Uncharacterized protein n=1 Tax=Rhodopirellula islandica TaxID=595434 RepID=A0A0J1B9R8_RHOIS|nr:hypothetical protein RISK_004590 [Rhodopirellula islandica]
MAFLGKPDVRFRQKSLAPVDLEVMPFLVPYCQASLKVQSRNKIGIRNQSVNGDGLSTQSSTTFQRM